MRRLTPLVAAGNRKVPPARGKTGRQMTLPPPRVGHAFSSFSHRLGLAVHGGRGYHSSQLPPPPPPAFRHCGADCLHVVSYFVNRLSSPCRRRPRAWFMGSPRSCAVIGTSPLLLRQRAGLSVNRCDVRGSVQLCAEACGVGHSHTQSETCHGQDVACAHDVAAGPAAWGGAGAGA